MSEIANGFGISSNVNAMMPYQAGKPIEDLAREFGLDPASIVKLASNENPLGMSDSVRQAISAYLENVPGQALGRYPDPNAFLLKQALAEHYQVPVNWLTVGNGSNDLLEIISLAILDHQASCVYAEHAFIVYKLATQARGARHIKVPAANYGHDLEAMFAAIADDTRLVFIANPNNPTGTFHSGEVIRGFVEKVHAAYGNRVTVVLDEAYNEYLDPQLRFDSAQLVRDFSNVIVVRTFSKAYGLAGIRMGFAIARPELTDYLNRVRQPFNVNLLAQVAAIAALKDAAFLEKTYELNREGKQWLAAQFTEMGLAFVPSFGNFILLHVGDAAAVNTALLQRGVIVRPVIGDGLPEHLRISIGLPEENARFISALKEVLGKCMSIASEHAADVAPALSVPVLAVVGVGLIGGSLALSLKRNGVVGKVLGISHDPASINKALELGIIDAVASFEQISQADAIVIATPVSAFESVCDAIKPFLAPHALITDVCSTKQQAIAMARRSLGERVAQFVPGHPIAGAETSGPQAANAFLFEQKQVILAPLQENTPEQINLLTRLWEACGSTVSSMDPAEHDRIFAAVSHMPHFLSALYMYSLLGADQTDRKFKYAGSGFRDFTRIAAGPPIMWRDIFSSNRDCMLEEITRFQTCLERARHMLESGDNDAFEAWLAAAAQARRDWENPPS